MIDSATIPEAKLHKRHQILSFHFVQNMIAAKFINLQFLRSEFNIADIVSKNWAHQTVYPYIIWPLLHYEGDTANILDNDLFFDYSDDDTSEADDGEY